MKKAISLIVLSIVFITISRLAAKYGIAWNVRYPPTDPNTYWDMKSIRLKWELIEIGLLGLSVVSFGTAVAVYFYERKKVG